MSATEIPLSTQTAAGVPAGSGARARLGRWAALPVLMAGTAVIVLDFFIVNVALAAIQSDLHGSRAATEWIVSGYGLTFATMLIVAGRAGDRFGRRRTFSVGVALFTFASAACAAADSATVLVVARLAQGLGGAIMSPNILSILGVTYTGEDRIKALSAYGIVMGIAAAMGQLVGGALIAANVAGLGWRTIFLINVPIGLVVLLAAPRLVPESRSDARNRLDLVGTVLVTLALTAVVLPLVQGHDLGWPAWTWISLGASPILLIEFVLYERHLARRGGSPLVNPKLFAERTFSAGLATQFGLWCGQASFFLVLALYLQQGRGLTALQSGLVFTILAVAYLVASMRAASLTAVHGRRLITVGALVLAGGHALLIACVVAVGTGGSVALLVPGLLGVGAGMGLCITPVTATVLSRLDPSQAGAATGLLSTMQQVGNAVGVAIVGVIFFGVHGIAQGFEWSLVDLAVLLIAVAALARQLPAPAKAA
jgi:EmrB/QacA subfamily drug resistance transporter